MSELKIHNIFTFYGKRAGIHGNTIQFMLLLLLLLLLLKRRQRRCCIKSNTQEGARKQTHWMAV